MSKNKIWFWRCFTGFSVFWALFALTNMVLLWSIPDNHFGQEDLYGNHSLKIKNSKGTLICESQTKKNICVQISVDGEFMYFIYEGKVIHGKQKQGEKSGF